jgi:hypothetical protein
MTREHEHDARRDENPRDGRRVHGKPGRRSDDIDLKNLRRAVRNGFVVFALIAAIGNGFSWLSQQSSRRDYCEKTNQRFENLGTGIDRSIHQFAPDPQRARRSLAPIFDAAKPVPCPRVWPKWRFTP